MTASYEVRAGTHTPLTASVTVGKAVEQWLAHCEAEGLEHGSIVAYRTTVEHHVLPYLGKVKLAQLTAPAVEQFRDDLLTGNLPGGIARSRTTAAAALGRLKAAIADAMRRGQVAQNVASGVTVKSSARHERTIEVGVDVPDKDEIRAILAAASPQWRPMLVVAVFCGLRASELRGLRWQDVDLERRLLKVRQRASLWCQMGPPKSAAGKRNIPLAPIVLNTLREWRLACPRGELGLVFPDDAGGVLDHWNLARHGFEAAQRAAGVVDAEGAAKYGPRAFRHACCSLWIAQGFQPKRIQGFMGHSSITMTLDRYGHLFPVDEDDHDRLAAGERALLDPAASAGGLKVVSG